MKVTVNREQLLAAMKVCQHATPQKAFLPIQEYVLLDIKGENCLVRSNDSEIQVCANVRVKSNEDFKMCLKADVIVRTLSDMKEEEIIIEHKKAKNNSLSAQIKASGKRYSVGVADPGDFPDFNTGKETGSFTTLASEFVYALQRLDNIINPKELRAQLQGVSVVFKDGKISVYGGTNFVMGRLNLNIISSTEDLFSFILPRKVINVLATLKPDGDASVKVFPNCIVVNQAGFEIYSTLINSKVANFDSMFDRKPEESFIIDKESIEGAIRRVRHYADDITKALTIELLDSNQASITAKSDISRSDAEEIIDNVEHSFANGFHVSFNHKVLLDCVSMIPASNIKFYGKTFKDALHIEPQYQLDDIQQEWLLMPLNLDNANSESENIDS